MEKFIGDSILLRFSTAEAISPITRCGLRMPPGAAAGACRSCRTTSGLAAHAHWRQQRRSGASGRSEATGTWRTPWLATR